MFGMHRSTHIPPAVASHQGINVHSTKQPHRWEGCRLHFVDHSWVDFGTGVMYATHDNDGIFVVNGTREVSSLPGQKISFLT